MKNLGYEAPVIELIEVEIEKGYTSSVPAPDYENGGEFEN